MSGAPPREVVVATAGGAAGAVVVALAFLVLPTGMLETGVVLSGVAGLVNAAAPPLGLVARLLLAGAGGTLAGAVCWAVLVLALGDRRVRLARGDWRLPRLAGLARRSKTTGPSLRRADSHPDAPPRPPILAGQELGVPFLSIVAAQGGTAASDDAVRPDGRALPADLDTALAAIDPAAIPDVPREPVRVVAPLAPPPPVQRPVPLAPGERIVSVELGSNVRERPDSIEALLARLEQGTRRRPATAPDKTAPVPVAPAVPPAAPLPAPPSGSLDETLVQLRRLATGR